ncbi:MAG: hypothetical protein M3O67_04780 [Bacteroidota bacterium]|nr:hypothetical protein [Bacteroidota bacterium]
MLCINNYTHKYINECRSKVDLQLSTYKKFVPKTGSAKEPFETSFFNHLVMALDYYFIHRSRTLELNEGNPCNEVRMLCYSIMSHNNKLTPQYKNTIYNPDKSVLKYKIGDEIKLTEPQFSLLYKAFFADIEKKFL